VRVDGLGIRGFRLFGIGLRCLGGGFCRLDRAFFGTVCTDEGAAGGSGSWKETRKHRLREVISGIRKGNVLFDAMDMVQRTSEGVTVQYEREEDQLPDSVAKGIR
jgi:hypothetical protein